MFPEEWRAELSGKAHGLQLDYLFQINLFIYYNLYTAFHNCLKHFCGGLENWQSKLKYISNDKNIMDDSDFHSPHPDSR